jgi:sec-independent protein translocase protein TatB
MLDLSPVKLLLLLIVAMILLGPDKLPQVARQLGAGWRKLQSYREQLDREVRQSIPDLPSSQDLARYARSPVTLLNQLAEMPSSDELVEDPGASTNGDGGWRADPAAADTEWSAPPDPASGPSRVETGPTSVPDDPTLN